MSNFSNSLAIPRSSRRTLDSLEGQRTQLIRQIAAKEVAGEDGLGTGYGHLKAQIEVVEANIEDVRSRLA